MQLRRVELHGFKTFANPVTLEFSTGITAIVGPNGSGKSNVSDALLWVLGEANVRTLRGGKLQDVIFAGSSARRPTGMAEVALTFDNSSRRLPLDFNEVTITRRVYRSEESEYFINRTACRLRDIVDLFLDTGIGRESYFALNQGEIDMILSADPEERRSLFEEAAGVKKYRVRKKESLRKLETTEQNLTRIHDLIAEVESRVAPLERQADAARRYQELSEKLREAELSAFASEWQTLRTREGALSDSLHQASAELSACQARLARLSVDEEEARLALQEADRAMEEAHRKHEAAVVERTRAEGRGRSIQARQASLAAEASRRQRLLEQNVGQQEDLAKEQAAAQAALHAAEADLQNREAGLADLRRQLADADARWRTATAELDSAQSQAVAAAAALARRQSDREAAAARLAAVRTRLQELEARAVTLRSERLSLAERREHLDALDRVAETDRQALLREREQESAGIREQEEARSSLLAELSAAESRLAADSSRLKVLEELQEGREGFFKGARSVLQAARRDLRGHYRAVVDLLDVERAHEAALEAALGASAQDIVTFTDEEARAGIAYLKRTGAGRATFLSLELVTDFSRGRWSGAAAAGFMGTAADLVQFEPVYGPVVEMLLGRVLVFDTLENGTAAARRLSHWSRIVTLEGEVISSQGALTGGSRAQSRGSLVGRVSQIQELRGSLQRDTEALESLRERRQPLEARLQETRAGQAARERHLQALNTEVAQRARDRSHLDSETRRLEREEQALAQEQERGQAMLRRETESLEQLERDRDAASPSNPVTAASLDLLRDAVRESAEAREHLRDEIARVQAELAGLQERRRAVAASGGDLSRRLDRVRSERTTLAAQAASSAADIQALAVELETIEQQAAAAVQELSGVQTVLEQARAGREAILAALERLSEQNRTVHQAHQALSQTSFTLESALSELRAEQARIRAVLSEDYGVEEPNGEGRDNDLDREDPVDSYLAPIRPSEQAEKDRQLATRLRRQMRALEPVNLEAIEESAAVAERLEFLQRQRQDIEEAARDLKAVIARIDEEAQERFLATFRAVAGHFDDLFRQLFGGGQTRLSLTDPANPYESGIEIAAQPPGKKLQNLQLLSGGERSLTAVALLFAMLRHRPVPFCIMDEVDAALDEANVARFGEMVKEFAEQTQFIIITHNRGTMEVADRLFGVTMREPGISTVLSLRLSEVPPSSNGHTVPPAAEREFAGQSR